MYTSRMYLVAIMSSRLADDHKSSQMVIDIAGEILRTFRVGPCEATEHALHYGTGLRFTAATTRNHAMVGGCECTVRPQTCKRRRYEFTTRDKIVNATESSGIVSVRSLACRRPSPLSRIVHCKIARYRGVCT